MSAIFNVVANHDSELERVVVPIVAPGGDGCIESITIGSGEDAMGVFEGGAIMAPHLRPRSVTIRCGRLSTRSAAMLSQLMVARTPVTVDPLVGWSTAASWRATRGSADLVGNLLAVGGAGASTLYAWDPWRKKLVSGGPPVLLSPWGPAIVTEQTFTNVVTGWNMLEPSRATSSLHNAPGELGGWDLQFMRVVSEANPSSGPYVKIKLGDLVGSDDMIGVSLLVRGTLGTAATLYIQTYSGGTWYNSGGRRNLWADEGLTLDGWRVLSTASLPPDPPGSWNTSDPDYTRVILGFSHAGASDNAVLEIGAVAVKIVGSNVRQGYPSFPKFNSGGGCWHELDANFPEVGSLTMGVVMHPHEIDDGESYLGLADLKQTHHDAINNDGKLTVYCRYGSVAMIIGGNSHSIYQADLTDGDMHALTYTWGSGQVKCYLDGTLRGMYSSDAPEFNSGAIRFGRAGYAAYPLLITALRVDNEVLPEAAVRSLHDALRCQRTSAVARAMAGHQFLIEEVPDTPVGRYHDGQGAVSGDLRLRMVSFDSAMEV